MTKDKEIRRCETCGQIIEILKGTDIPIICCGNEMTKMEEQKEDSSFEKHVPFIEKIDDSKVRIKVGEKEKHPMTNEHYIKFIEVLTGKETLRVQLTPQDEPEATFNVKKDNITKVRAYCNIHGLWVNE